MKGTVLGSMLCLLISGLTSAAFGLDLVSIKWQKTAAGKKGAGEISSEVKEWKQKAYAKSSGTLKVIVTLANRAPVDVEGSVLSCAVSMHLVEISSKTGAGLWTVPFWLEERRVPKIKTTQSVEVAIPRLDLQANLTRLKNTGFWPDALKIQVMLGVRPGDRLDRVMLESVLPVTE